MAKRVKILFNTQSTLELDINEVPHKGTVTVHTERFNSGSQHRVLHSPNYDQIIDALESVQTEVGDYSHIYLEDISVESQNGMYDLYPVLGS